MADKEREAGTPRTDAAAVGFGRLLVDHGTPDNPKFDTTELVPADFARELERELAEREQIHADEIAKVARYYDAKPASAGRPTGEPWAYAIPQKPGSEFDYLVFPNKGDADAHLADLDEEEREGEIIPLYPPNSFAPSAIERSPSDIRTISDDERADRIGVERFAAAMLAKLEQKRLEGRYGWNRENSSIEGGCTVDFLRKLLAEHVGKGDPVDVGNLAMMIWNRVNPLGLLREPDRRA